MEAHGQFEDEIFRSFAEQSHAEEFMSGRIRFGHIYSYKRIEDVARRDRTEGVSHLKVDGISTSAMIASNSIYICCFHRTRDAADRSKFGSFLVRVGSPRNLADELTKAINSRDERFYGGVEGAIVEYTKGDDASTKPTSCEMARLIYAQKPREPFEQENEFRLAIISKENLDDYFTVDIGKPVANSELIA